MVSGDIEKKKEGLQKTIDEDHLLGKIISAKDLIYSGTTTDMGAVENIVPEAALTILAGPPGSRKTFLALKLALCVSTGRDFLKFPTKKCKVLYVDEENGGSVLGKRIELLKVAESFTDEDLDQIDFITMEGFKMNASYQKQLRELIEDKKPKLIIIDSLVRIMHGDQNSEQDMKVLFDLIKPLMTEYEAAFLVLHHTRKTEGRKGMDDVRGSGEIAAAAASVLMANVKDNNTGSITQVKNRNGECIKECKFTVFSKKNEKGEEGINIDYAGDTNYGLTVAEVVAEEIKNIISKNYVSGSNFTSKTAHTSFCSLCSQGKFSHNSVSDSLKLLENKGVLAFLKRGEYRVT